MKTWMEASIEELEISCTMQITTTELSCDDLTTGQQGLFDEGSGSKIYVPYYPKH